MTTQDHEEPSPMAVPMSELAESFPSLRGMPGTRPWKPELLARRVSSMSTGQQYAAQFVLYVWGGGTYPRLQPFDLFAAMLVWDKLHREACAAWIARPFWP